MEKGAFNSTFEKFSGVHFESVSQTFLSQVKSDIKIQQILFEIH